MGPLCYGVHWRTAVDNCNSDASQVQGQVRSSTLRKRDLDLDGFEIDKVQEGPRGAGIGVPYRYARDQIKKPAMATLEPLWRGETARG